MPSLSRLLRRSSSSLAKNVGKAPQSSLLTPLVLALVAGLQRLDLSRDPRKTLAKVRAYKPTVGHVAQLVIMAGAWLYSLWVMVAPWPLKVALPALWTAAVLMPITGQFVWPATPVLSWVILFFSARYIPTDARPSIHVALLPALESVLYGANISDLQTRFTHPLLDVLAWLPYGVVHFTLPFVVAALLWLFGPKGAVQYWGKAFGFMNLFGVITQIILPCAAPWYEIIHGLTPADYSMPGSPGGLLRIDRIFHSNGYTNTFGNAPLVFGAFPSLHSGCAVMEALFLSHFFPKLKPLYWGYTGVLWWATMYLSHHYLIDLTGGACLSVLTFYLFMPSEFKDSDQLQFPNAVNNIPQYELVSQNPDRPSANGHAAGGDVDFDEEIRRLEEGDRPDRDADRDAAQPNTDRDRPKQPRTVSWGETRVLGE